MFVHFKQTMQELTDQEWKEFHCRLFNDCVCVCVCAMLLLTWESQVCKDSILPLLFIVHKRQVNIQKQEDYTRQEANHPDANSVAARRVALVKDAMRLWAPRRVDVSLCGDAGKHHHGKQLLEKRGKLYPLTAYFP